MGTFQKRTPKRAHSVLKQNNLIITLLMICNMYTTMLERTVERCIWIIEDILLCIASFFACFIFERKRDSGTFPAQHGEKEKKRYVDISVLMATVHEIVQKIKHFRWSPKFYITEHLSSIYILGYLQQGFAGYSRQKSLDRPKQISKEISEVSC